MIEGDELHSCAVPIIVLLHFSFIFPVPPLVYIPAKRNHGMGSFSNLVFSVVQLSRHAIHTYVGVDMRKHILDLRTYTQMPRAENIGRPLSSFLLQGHSPSALSSPLHDFVGTVQLTRGGSIKLLHMRTL